MRPPGLGGAATFLYDKSQYGIQQLNVAERHYITLQYV